MRVEIRLRETSQPRIFENVENTYQKGDFFCVYLKCENKVIKIPIGLIFDIIEDYDSGAILQK